MRRAKTDKIIIRTTNNDIIDDDDDDDNDYDDDDEIAPELLAPTPRCSYNWFFH